MNLLTPLKDAPPPGDADRLALGFETRLMARLREQRRDRASQLRWGVALGGIAAASLVLLAQQGAQLVQASVSAAGASTWLMLLSL